MVHLCILSLSSLIAYNFRNKERLVDAYYSDPEATLAKANVGKQFGELPEVASLKCRICDTVDAPSEFFALSCRHYFCRYANISVLFLFSCLDSLFILFLVLATAIICQFTSRTEPLVCSPVVQSSSAHRPSPEGLCKSSVHRSPSISTVCFSLAISSRDPLACVGVLSPVVTGMTSTGLSR